MKQEKIERLRKEKEQASPPLWIDTQRLPAKMPVEDGKLQTQKIDPAEEDASVESAYRSVPLDP